LEKSGDLSLRLAGEDIGYEEAFDGFVRLHQARWQGGMINDSKSIGFYRLLGKRMLERDSLFLALLALDGVPITARFGLVHGGKLFVKQGGWDPSMADARLGTVMTGAVIQWGLDNGLMEVDFLWGNDPHKPRWATGHRQLVDLLVANPHTLRGRLYSAARLDPSGTRAD
jgi:CelD/BcsL family acetyltransferase involved in cellulose biosynthesis